MPLDVVGPGRVELCGVGVVSELDARNRELGERQMRLPPKSAAQFASDLASGGSDAHKGLVVYLDGWRARARAQASVDVKIVECGEQDRACTSRVLNESMAVGTTAFEPALRALMRLTATTAEPAVFAMAAQGCLLSGAVPSPSQDACAALSLERWAQLDSDNAVPWIHLAWAARVRKDEAAVADALFHASVARRVDHYGDSFIAMSSPAIERQTDPVDRLRIITELVSVESTWAFPPFMAALEWCKSPDGNRRQVCDAIGKTLVEHSRTMIDRGIGIRIGEGAGWETDRVAALRQERDAYLAAMTSGGTQDLSTCAGWQREMDQAVRRSRIGEFAHGRELALKSGKSIEILAAPATESRIRAASAAAAKALSSAASGAR